MEVLIKKKIGRTVYHYTFTGANLYDVHTEAQRLSFEDVEACGCCGSDNLEMVARHAQNKYKYVGVKCRDCRAEVTMGRRQEDADTFFLRKKEGGRPGELDWQAYKPEGGQPS